MEKIDVEKLKVAMKYISRMEAGNNPINNQKLPDDSFVHNPNVVRCFAFVEDVLTKVCDNHGYIGRIPKRVRDDMNFKEFPLEVLERFQYTGDKTITKIVNQINDLVTDLETKKIRYEQITDWLKRNGYLAHEFVQEINKETTVPTQKGNDIGISSEISGFQSGKKYVRISYNEQAQYFIVNNMKDILQ